MTIVNGIIAVVLGYLLGSIPSAYIATRLAVGKDLRRLGGGNVGGLNVYREVGAIPALAAGIADLGKGAAAVAIALWLLDVSQPFVLITALAAVAGHNWMLFLKFSGGKGMGSTIGALSILFPLYGYPFGLAFFFGVVLIPMVITRNVALSMGIGLVSLPFIAWLGMKSTPFIIFTIVLELIILVKFIPTARTALVKAETKKDFVFDRWQKDKDKRGN